MNKKQFNVFSFVKSINETKQYVYNEETAKEYNQFIICRALSYFMDTVIYAEDVSKMKHVDDEMKYDYLLNTIRPRNRYKPWLKRSSSEDFELIQKHFNYSPSKTKQAMRILSKSDIDKIRLMYGASDDKRDKKTKK